MKMLLYWNDQGRFAAALAREVSACDQAGNIVAREVWHKGRAKLEEVRLRQEQVMSCFNVAPEHVPISMIARAV
ncbi:hypothetical protein DB347_17750 [Opitutaceae bacterium EW11]|nr:hypothetical protein DB347_17750 [Opitutaceae bacterium EW11]